MRSQAVFPFNPQGRDGVAPDLSFNTAISFITNANWQAYAGETTMNYFAQMAGLTTHNFLDTAVVMALALGLTRAFVRNESATIGNFWVDMTRSVLYVLLPLSIFTALLFVALGVPQTLAGSFEATTLEGARQTIAIGPVASQEAIKLLGKMAGDFSTPIRRIRSKIRAHCRTWPRTGASSCFRSPSFSPSAEWWATFARGVAS